MAATGLFRLVAALAVEDQHGQRNKSTVNTRMERSTEDNDLDMMPQNRTKILGNLFYLQSFYQQKPEMILSKQRNSIPNQQSIRLE